MTAKLSVATFNVNGFKESIDSFAETLRTDPPLDVVGLQEAVGVEQVNSLAEKLDMKVAVISCAAFGLHNALLVRKDSQVEVKHTYEWVLDGGETTERRVAVAAHCMLPKKEDRNIVIINVHLDALSEDVRLKQVRSLKSKVDSLFNADEPVYDPTIDIKDKLAKLEAAFEKGSLSETGFHKAKEMLIKQEQDGVSPPAPEKLLPIDGWMLLGDLNSLTHADHTEQELEELRARRLVAKVEAPRFTVSHELMCQYDLVDSVTLAKAKPETTHTSKHAVRVDYILFSYSLLTVVKEVVKHHHVVTPISDHSLVTSEFILV
eukprot:TRINITY_DN25416_c0_g1_i1.p1 TRINITY_DN25416_c0_g1~~TRINITY_DN25416_c0_g1_i1.p1  ORF type:complete len:319 (+),score=94.99 TRINITY_DN25416_c0_g1_i1:34-990(+)